MKERLSRVDDKPEGDAESAGGGVEDDVVAEAWRRDEEAATSQCSGRRWWQLPVAGQPLPLDRTRVRTVGNSNHG